MRVKERRYSCWLFQDLGEFLNRGWRFAPFEEVHVSGTGNARSSCRKSVSVVR